MANNNNITDNKLFIGLILAAVAYMMIGPQKSAENHASNVGNLPATNANVKANAQAINWMAIEV